MDQNPQPLSQSALDQKRKNRTKLALVLLIGPTLLGIISSVITVIANYAIAPIPSSDSLFGSTSNLESALNIITFILSAITSITWLPGIVIGIVLLATKPEAQQSAEGAQPSQTGTFAQAPVYAQQLSVEQQAELSGRKTRYLIWGLVSLILPTVLGIVAIITAILAISNGFAGNPTHAEQTIYPIIFIITGIASFITFTPGIVVGILLLVKRTKLLPKQQPNTLQ